MLSRIAAIREALETLSFYLSATPEIWQLDNIDPTQLSILQQQEFADEWMGAEQELDSSPYDIENGILYSLAEPYKRAGRYSRLMLPHRCRQQIIDRCHLDVAHAAFAKTLARVQEHYTCELV